MSFIKEHEKEVLGALAIVFVLLVVYRIATSEKPKTAPLTYGPGAVVSSPVRKGISSSAAGQADPLVVFFARKEERFPGISRDLFRMSNPVPKPKTPPAPVMPATPLPPPVPQKTPEEIAADAARAELARFRFIGYLTEKDNSVFLQKDGETFIVKNGDIVQKSFQIKNIGNDHVIILDTVTHVEARVELAGGTPGGEPGSGPAQKPMAPPGFSPPGFPRPPVPQPGR